MNGLQSACGLSAAILSAVAPLAFTGQGIEMQGAGKAHGGGTFMTTRIYQLSL
jgi:hypothetical protein